MFNNYLGFLLPFARGHHTALVEIFNSLIRRNGGKIMEKGSQQIIVKHENIFAVYVRIARYYSQIHILLLATMFWIISNIVLFIGADNRSSQTGLVLGLATVLPLLLLWLIFLIFFRPEVQLQWTREFLLRVAKLKTTFKIENWDEWGMKWNKGRIATVTDLTQATNLELMRLCFVLEPEPNLRSGMVEEIVSEQFRQMAAAAEGLGISILRMEWYREHQNRSSGSFDVKKSLEKINESGIIHV